MRCPRIGVDATRASQLFDVVGVHHAEVEAELLQHLEAPLLLKRCGAHDQDGARTISKQQLLNDQTGFDGLAETDIVGDEQVDARHVDGAHQRVELEVLNADATTERCLGKSPGGHWRLRPAHGAEEGVEHARIVLPRDRRQARALEDLGARLVLPDYFQLFA